MLKPEMTLFKSALELAVAQLAEDASSESAWSAVQSAVRHYEVKADDDTDLSDAIELQDTDGLTEVLGQWNAGERLLLVRDRDVLKRALKAYRKRLKVTLLDAESSVSGGPMSAGRSSDIVGITPPERYPREVWDELVRQKRLLDRGRGTYELPQGG